MLEQVSHEVVMVVFRWILSFLQTLGLEYETVVNKKPLSVLHALLLSGFDSRYKLMDSYIKAIQLDTAEVKLYVVFFFFRR